MSETAKNRLDVSTVIGAAQNSSDPEVQRAILALLTKQGELVDLQLSEQRRTIGEREETLRITKAARDSNIADVKKNVARVKNEQDNCIHRKPAPSHEPSIGGQRDHRQQTHFICLYCHQEWLGNELPNHLRIPAERIGGPFL